MDAALAVVLVAIFAFVCGCLAGIPLGKWLKNEEQREEISKLYAEGYMFCRVQPLPQPTNEEASGVH